MMRTNHWVSHSPIAAPTNPRTILTSRLSHLAKNAFQLRHGRRLNGRATGLWESEAVRDIDDTLRKYADLTIRVGLNLQPGQRLAIIGPLANGGVSLDAAPLVRCLTETAYRAGASYVEAIWGDEALQLARFSH